MKILSIILLLGVLCVLNAQEDPLYSSETDVLLTGYVAFNGEWVNNLRSFSELQSDKGFNLSEASLLTTINSSEKLSFFSVLTYKPRLSLNFMFAELSMKYSVSEEFNLKIGRFLLPINPINSNYFAPANVGIALPSFITNHKLFPLNINGVEFNGNILVADGIDFNYHIVGGSYYKIQQTAEGVVGFFGREGLYMDSDLKAVKQRLVRVDSINSFVPQMYWGSGFRTELGFYNNLKIGIGGFYSSEESTKQTADQKTVTTNVDLFAIGADFRYSIFDFDLNSSLWFGIEEPVDSKNFVKKDYHMITWDLAYSGFKDITPYTRAELIRGMTKEDRTRILFGINYRPSYDFTFKLEYIRYLQDFVEEFDILQFSTIYSF